MQGVNCSLIPLDVNGLASPIADNVLIGNEILSLLLIEQGDAVVAYRNVCPHQGRRLDYAPGKLLLKDGTLICPAHGAVFALADGLCVQGPCRGESLQRYACERIPEGVRIAWPEPALKTSD